MVRSVLAFATVKVFLPEIRSTQHIAEPRTSLQASQSPPNHSPTRLEAPQEHTQRPSSPRPAAPIYVRPYQPPAPAASPSRCRLGTRKRTRLGKLQRQRRLSIMPCSGRKASGSWRPRRSTRPDETCPPSINLAQAISLAEITAGTRPTGPDMHALEQADCNHARMSHGKIGRVLGTETTRLCIVAQNPDRRGWNARKVCAAGNLLNG